MEREMEGKIIPKAKEKHIFRSIAPSKDLIDCECCENFFNEDEVSVSEGVIDGVRSFYLLCAKCCSQCNVNK